MHAGGVSILWEFGTCLYGLGVWRFWTREFEGTEFMCLCN